MRKILLALSFLFVFSMCKNSNTKTIKINEPSYEEGFVKFINRDSSIGDFILFIEWSDSSLDLKSIDTSYIFKNKKDGTAYYDAIYLDYSLDSLLFEIKDSVYVPINDTSIVFLDYKL